MRAFPFFRAAESREKEERGGEGWRCALKIVTPIGAANANAFGQTGRGAGPRVRRGRLNVRGPPLVSKTKGGGERE